MNMNPDMNPDNEVFLLNNPQQPRIFGLTSKLVLYYHNPITGQLVTLKLKRRHPHPIKNTFILLNKHGFLDIYLLDIYL